VIEKKNYSENQKEKHPKGANQQKKKGRFFGGRE
jgi:hypothetical protein